MTDDIQDLVDNEESDLEDKLFESSSITRRTVDAAGQGEATSMPGVLHEITYDQPVCKATMVCLRGPCEHYWTLTARFVAPGEEMHLQRNRFCTCYEGSETNLGSDNVYHCNRWWPLWLSHVPATLRGMLRPQLVRLYERYLKFLGYDMKWKYWPDDVFESDDPEFRKDLGLGGTRPRLKDYFKQKGPTA